MNTERELTGKQWSAATSAFLRMYGMVKFAATTEQAQAFADTAAQEIYNAILDALPPATADAPAKVGAVATVRPGTIRRLNYLLWMKDCGGSEPPEEWKEAYTAGYEQKAHEQRGLEAMLDKISAGDVIPHPQTQPSAATAVNTAEGDLPLCPCGAAVDLYECPYPMNHKRTLWTMNCTNSECSWNVIGDSIEDCLRQWRIRASPPASASGDVSLPFENMLSELIGKLVPDLDTGDILADAKTASVRIDQLQHALRSIPIHDDDAESEGLRAAALDGVPASASMSAGVAGGLYTNPFDLIGELRMHHDFALGFALCNRDHAGTRRDVKKAQSHILAIIAQVEAAERVRGK